MYLSPVLENQMEKNMENAMETGRGCIYRASRSLI